MAIDRYGRRLQYLRISLTDHCNLRCLYCMPEEMVFRPSAELMQDDEILTLVRLFVSLGFDKIRLTGGEPTIRLNVVDLVQQIADIPGVNILTMTTNGVRLPRLALPLKQAGLQRVNISLDTLDPEKFHTLTRWGSLEDVWTGIQAAEDAGLTPVKINAVVVRGYNEQDMLDLARLTLEHPWQVRFIEMMPFGGNNDFQMSQLVTASEMRAYIEPRPWCIGTSQRWRSGWRSTYFQVTRSSWRYWLYLLGQRTVLPFLHPCSPDCGWTFAPLPAAGR